MIAHTSDHSAVYYNTRGKGQLLLIVHCAAGDADTYPGLVDALASRVRCVTFDRLGYHRSTRFTRDTTVEEQVAGISAVHRQVTAEPVWIFAHSGGCNFALAYALIYPERVKGLILVEPALYGIFQAHEKPAEVERIEQFILPLFRQGEFANGRAEFNALFGWPTVGPISENWRYFGRELPVITGWCPSEARLNQLTLPVLILEGENSPALVNAIGHRLAAQLGGANLITLAEQGHQVVWAEPALIAAQVMAFISKTEIKPTGL